MFSRHVIDLLSSYLDAQLPDKKRAQVEKHITECVSCARELQRMRLLSSTLKNWQAPEPPVAFDRKVKEKIVLHECEKETVAMKSIPRFVWIPSSALAGLLVVFIVGNVYLHRGIQGKMRDTSEVLRQQYTPGYAQDENRRQAGPYADNGEYEVAYRASAGTARHWDAERAKDPFLNGINRKAAGGREVDAVSEAVAIARNAAVSASLGDRRARGELIPASGYISGAPEKTAFSPAPTVPEGPLIIIQPTLPATSESEKIIRSALMRLEVEDGKDAYGKLLAVCQEAGGFLASSQLNKDDDGRNSGSVVMRVPKDKFLAVLERIRTLGQVRDFTTDSQDVTQQYKNIKTRLDAEMVVYNKALEALKKRQNTVDDTIQMASQLDPILQRVETLKNELERIDNSVSYATVTVNFFEPWISQKILANSGRYIRESAMAAAVSFVKFLANILPMLVVLLFWAVVGILTVLGIRGWIRKNNKKE